MTPADGGKAPFYVISDLGRAVGRALLTWGGQIGNDIDRIGAEMSAVSSGDKDLILSDNPQLYTSVRATGVLVNDYAADRFGNIARSFFQPPQTPEATRDYINGDAIHLSLGQIVGQPGDVSGDVILFWLMLPVKLASSPILDATGSAAWDNMYRRALILFDGFSVAQLKRAANDDQVRNLVLNRGDGACTRLVNQVFKKLALRTRANDVKDGLKDDPLHPENGKRPYEITLIGHSMGSIVLNEVLRRSDDVDYEQIVYMAAACSVRDFQRAVIPYMEEHPRTVFYNLTLNPGNDVREVEGYEVPPRGSLLVWIDDMFANPYTPLDRTLGRWDNIVEAVYVIPKKLRGRIRLKAFEMYLKLEDAPKREEDKYVVSPQKHGDFSACRFWRNSFWEPASPPEASVTISKYIRQTESKNQRSLQKQAQQEQRQQEQQPVDQAEVTPATWAGRALRFLKVIAASLR
jgi:pimeloyl-ACP methyl ester carboxylesterase